MARTGTTNNRLAAGLLALGLACLAVVVAGWAANRDDANDAERWAEALCGSLATWRDDVRRAAGEIGGEVGLDGAPPGLTTLDDAYFDVRDATEELADALRAIGAPDTDGGDAARSRLRQLAERLDSLVGQLLGAAGSTEVITDADGLRGLADQVVTVVDEIRGLDAAEELRDALGSRRACRDLSSPEA
jgi:hypothetical protein